MAVTMSYGKNTATRTTVTRLAVKVISETGCRFYIEFRNEKERQKFEEAVRHFWDSK